VRSGDGRASVVITSEEKLSKLGISNWEYNDDFVVNLRYRVFGEVAMILTPVLISEGVVF
jgi:hypothetical protein